jgi:predicted ATPase/predicted Ser/Thr protein kinase
MTSERYEKIGQLFHAALELPAENRAAFLSGACGADLALRQEVESLLDAHEHAGDFATALPAGAVAAWLAGADQTAGLTGTIGAYEVLSPIGRGGMGEVYLAHDTRLGRKVAVKVLQAQLTSNPDAARRFEQEARAASSLNHPNIVTIYEIGDLRDRRFIAMEFVEGQSLAAMIGRPMAAATLAAIGAQLARALSVAHAAGIVHRDIKPENVIVREDGYVKVLDFGLARLARLPTVEDSDAVTNPNLLLGTPRYMSPEQARGEIANAASDVFSLGVVLYELATGRHPFDVAGAHTTIASVDADSTLAMIHAIGASPAVTPSRWVPDLPVSLERLLVRMLEKTPASRPTAAQVEAELSAWSADARPPSSARGREGRTHNLPPQRTPLVGRSAEVASVKDLLLTSGVRLLTLTGPGGTGKTRLAIQAAEELVDHFDGVAFVNLAPIADPGLVASAVARALGVRESGDLTLVKAIADHLRGLGRALLVLDNFEQVSDAAALVRELLDACPDLQALVTSRLVLRIYGEQEFPVPPLPLPALGALFSPSTLMDYASVALFVQRAAAAKPDFALSTKNAAAVVEICRKLDGLPLAIELAAARVKILPPADLLARIDRPLDVLTGGARDLPERQQTLRQTIKWSYDLLSPAEQRLFRRLSVFAGGCTLEGAEAVCNAAEDLGLDVLDGITALVDNSLLVQRASEHGEPRFLMLETFREYARERLIEHGEAAATERAHAAYMLVVAEEETLEMNPAEREAWLRACDVELDNFRIAATRLIAAGDVEWALRLGAALFRFWEQRDHLTEGRETLARMLSMPGATSVPRLRARALYCAAVLADIQSDPDTAESLSREACEIYRQADDLQGMATTITVMAFQAQRRGRYDDSTALFSETAKLWERLGDTTAVELATSNVAHSAKTAGDYALARRLLEQLRASAQARGDIRAYASALNGLGDVAAAEGDRDAARRFYQEGLARYREVDDRWGVARVLADLANVDLQAADFEVADRSLMEALLAFKALGHQRGVARQLEALSLCAGSQRRYQAAVRLAGAAAAIRQRIGAPAKPLEREKIERTLAQARAGISAEEYAAAWKEGLSAPLDRILGLETRP